MALRLATVVHMAPLLLLWQAAFPSTALRSLAAALVIVAFAATVRLVARAGRAETPRVLILGSGSMASKLIEAIEAPRRPLYVVAGIVDDVRPDPDSAGETRWLGPSARLADIVADVQPARIVVAVGDRRQGLPMEALLDSRVSGIVVEDVFEFYERLTGKIAIESLRPSALILAKGFRNHGGHEATARIAGLVGALVGLVLAAPFLAVLALAIRFDSRGPVLFVQPRAGRHGRPFGLLKFRTMHPCADARSEWVVDNLDRITPVGRWLRRFRLDELPQLVNVLRGDMNLIGPRPHPTGNHAAFVDAIAYYKIRNSVRPGVTGWAQVRYGYANNLAEETEKMRYDLFYIKNRSLWLDTRILLETVGIMIVGQGASEIRRPSPGRSELLPPPSRGREAGGQAVQKPWPRGLHVGVSPVWANEPASAQRSARKH